MLEAFSLAGKVALVTGGNGGLGRALARALRNASASVAVTGRDEAKNRDASLEFGQKAVLAVDNRDEAAIERSVAAVVGHFGGLDILVNCAGGFRGGDITDLSLEAWNDVLSSHLTGAYLYAKHSARAMIGAGNGGKIINVGSMYSLFGAPDFADYASLGLSLRRHPLTLLRERLAGPLSAARGLRP